LRRMRVHRLHGEEHACRHVHVPGGDTLRDLSLSRAEPFFERHLKPPVGNEIKTTSRRPTGAPCPCAADRTRKESDRCPLLNEPRLNASQRSSASSAEEPQYTKYAARMAPIRPAQRRRWTAMARRRASVSLGAQTVHTGSITGSIKDAPLQILRCFALR